MYITIFNKLSYQRSKEKFRSILILEFRFKFQHLTPDLVLKTTPKLLNLFRASNKQRDVKLKYHKNSPSKIKNLNLWQKFLKFEVFVSFSDSAAVHSPLPLHTLPIIILLKFYTADCCLSLVCFFHAVFVPHLLL